MWSFNPFKMPVPQEGNFEAKASSVDKSLAKSIQELISAVKHKERVPRVSHIVDDQELLRSVSTMVGSSFMACIVVGHPFLAYNVCVDMDFLRRHGLKLGKNYIVKEPSRTILQNALTEFGTTMECPVDAGGVAMGVAKATQWMLSQPNSVAFMGSRAIDEDAATLIDEFKNSQITFRLEAKMNVRTSVHLVLHCKKRWCQVYFIEDKVAGLSNAFIDRPIVTKMLERANLIFTTGLSILLMPQAVKKLAYYACSRFKQFSMALFDSGFVMIGKDKLRELMTYLDVLFVNIECAEAMVKAYNIPVPCSFRCSEKRYLREISNWVRGISHKTCTVIMSDGLKNAFVYTDVGESQTVAYKSSYLKDLHIVDGFGTNIGFVSGFLAYMMLDKKVDSCIDAGFFCASKIAGHYGINFPLNKTEVLSEWQAAKELRAVSKEPEAYAMPFTIFKTPWKTSDLELIHEENSHEIKNVVE